MNNIGIIGLGLIGGSIAKALKIRSNSIITALSRTEKSLLKAYEENIIDFYSTEDLSIFKECDIIFICTPVDKIVYYVENLIPFLKKGCIITDVGSTKNTIYEQMMKFENVCFIGGHPMAGSEKTSYEASKEYLFENAYYIITPSLSADKQQIDNFLKLLEVLGAIPIVISPQYHDYIVAAISHVPHIISSCLVNTVKNLDDSNNYMHTLAAGGFKDITRIASSSPEMWKSICFENKDEILKVLSSFEKSVLEFKDFIISDEKEKLYDFLESSKNYRNTFSDKKNSIIPYEYEILLDVVDRPGIIATIATMLSVNNINIKNIGIINNREYENGILQIILEHDQDRKKSIKLLEEMNFIVYNSK